MQVYELEPLFAQTNGCGWLGEIMFLRSSFMNIRTSRMNLLTYHNLWLPGANIMTLLVVDVTR